MNVFRLILNFALYSISIIHRFLSGENIHNSTLHCWIKIYYSTNLILEHPFICTKLNVCFSIQVTDWYLKYY